MKKNPIIVIGGGNMGGAIAIRWRQSQETPVHVVEMNVGRRETLSEHKIKCHATLKDAPRGSVYLLAIKPQQFADMLPELQARFGDSAPLLISIMAGIPLKDLHEASPRAVRVMPNLPAVIGESMSVLYGGKIDAACRKEACDLFKHIGATAWVEKESQLHAVTAISGSGPAYLFALMEALQKAATGQGLPADLAEQLVTQTMKGAALLIDASDGNATTLRKQVTSKGGTTEAALKALTKGEFGKLIAEAIDAATTRSKELAKS